MPKVHKFKLQEIQGLTNNMIDKIRIQILEPTR